MSNNDVLANNIKLTGGKSEKGITYETITSFTNNLPTGKKRDCFLRPVERCVIR